MSIKKRALLFGLPGLLAIAAIFMPVKLARSRPALAQGRLYGATNILLIGFDAFSPSLEGQITLRTDVLILAACDPSRHRIALLSIPRDTLVEIPGHGVQRINAAYGYGGVGLTTLMVENLTGLKIDRYAGIDFRGFAVLVDLLGGVEIEVDKRMEFLDSHEARRVLRPGKQWLDGERALGYVRSRHDPLGDITRVGRQQKLLRAVVAKAKQDKIWAKLPALYLLQKRYVRTDLSLLDLYRLRNFLLDLGSETGFCSYTLPGRFDGFCWAADPRALADLIAREFQPLQTGVMPKEDP